MTDVVQQNPITQTPQPNGASDKVRVVIRNRQAILFEENAKSVTSRNDTGTFDVLPEHANFISLINRSVTVHKLDGEDQTIELQNGVIKVKDNTIHCYVDLLSAEVPLKK